MRVGVSFSIPIEEILEHVALILRSRAPLHESVEDYRRLLRALDSKVKLDSGSAKLLLSQIESLRKELLSADQTLEDSANILTGYVGFLEQEEQHTSPPVVQQPDVAPPQVSEPPQEVENEE
tara:strand:- start:448 stop:813 length:366 start_codon:yes stop_codon:yes gene_type:complete